MTTAEILHAAMVRLAATYAPRPNTLTERGSGANTTYGELRRRVRWSGKRRARGGCRPVVSVK